MNVWKHKSRECLGPGATWPCERRYTTLGRSTQREIQRGCEAESEEQEGGGGGQQVVDGGKGERVTGAEVWKERRS